MQYQSSTNKTISFHSIVLLRFSCIYRYSLSFITLLLFDHSYQLSLTSGSHSPPYLRGCRPRLTVLVRPPLIPQLVSEGRYLIELPVSLTFIYLLYIYLFYLPLPPTLFYVLILILKPYVFIQIDLANQVSFQTTYFLKVSYSLKVIQLKLHLN